MTCYGQSKDDFNPIQTGVTSLSIAPDARGASMGDIGGATEPGQCSRLLEGRARRQSGFERFATILFARRDRHVGRRVRRPEPYPL